MKMPLEGYRVLDWTIWQQGPVASVMLGDLGADVIKIEERGIGDPSRGMVKLAGALTGVGGRNFYFENNNRNKRSLTVNLRKEKGKEIIYKLAEKSDVFVQNFRKGVAARQGLDYAALSRYNPRLIYASASGWGPEGPDAEKPSYDYTGLARSGLMNMVGEPGMPPLAIRGGICDQLGAVMTAYGVVTALLVRERTGIGQELDASLLGSMIWLQGLNVAMKLIMGTEIPREVRATARNPLWNHYQCKDGKWLVLAHLQPDRHWPIVCRALGMEHLEKDPRFVNMEVRSKNAAELISVMDKTFATKTREEWLKVLAEAGDLVFECVHTISDVVNDPQALANGYITEFQHPVWGPVKVVGPPVRFSKTPAAVQREAPEFGQHTEEILNEILGYSWDEITKLKDEEVI
jgi:crotonobetainyl-CoA:carnitine CoA-transferase CaiB-like acyl-CoA transferase